ncbi:MAG: nucleotidyltransferase domain-containing protein [Trueperaceae bacterium]|nr:nucleotidyltransferase domain-containing protein [Trueperaceae bacterium]
MTDDDRRRLREVFARYPEVAAVWLFGSHARGGAGAASDVDLAVEPRTPEARRRKLDMLGDLVEAGFENVDLIILDRNDPVLRFEAMQPFDVIYAAPGVDPFESFLRAFKVYWDTEPLRRRMRRRTFERFSDRAS